MSQPTVLCMEKILQRFYCIDVSITLRVYIRLVLVFACVFAASQAGYTQATTPENTTWVDQQRKAVQTFYKLDQSNNYTESLQYADMNVLPMGIRQTIANMEITIAVSDMRWEKTHSELTLFARVKVPDNNEDDVDRSLYFGAQGIKLSHTGDIIGDASLVLMGDFSMSILGGTASLTLLGSFDKNTGRAQELTYVSVDCKGFREMGIAAEVAFPQGLLVQVNTKGEATDGQVKAGFRTVVKDWSDILASVSLPPFMIKGLDGFVFTMTEAVFDQSDKRNDPSIVYPQGYQATYMIPGAEALWRGVYIRDLTVTLPKPFSDKSNIRPSFEGHHMLIDNNGVSGIFSATGLLPIDRGSASGWRFSVDDFSMSLEANRLTAAAFSGQIGLPVAKDSTLGYDAVITANDEYILRARVLDSLQFDVFRARAMLLPNSYIELKVIDGKFKPEAMLHGNLSLPVRLDGTGTDAGGKTIANFKGIEFRSLHLKTDAPKFTAEYFGYRGELKMMNFPISVSNIGVRALENEVALMVDVKLTLSDNMFAGSTKLEIVGELKKDGSSEGGGTEHWKYKTLKVGSIAVDAQIAGAVQLKASLTIMNDDPIYGDGYAGEMDLTFSKAMEGLNIKARGMFGRKDFRYWFVDGRVKFGGSGIPVFPPVNLIGFGGGISYRMKRSGTDLQASPTGCKFVPDETSGIGVKAAVLFNVANDAAINGEASFEMAFSKSGGLNFIGFYGFAKFMAKIPGADDIQNFVTDKAQKIAAMEQEFVKNNPKLAEALTTLKQYDPSGAALKVFQPSEPLGKQGFSAALGIQYDFEQNSLHATFDLYVTAAGGVVRGTASGNRAGWAVLHIDPKEWYLHMGTPTDRLGLKMGIAGISVETGAYLMMGSRIPGSPPPPQEVADILKMDLAKLDYMRDFNALGDGRGFAFGASVRVATGDISFLILYANFQAGVGFDIMLKDYGDMQCKGRSGAVGLDGWYANGQAYAYLQGELGVKVNLWFLKTKVPVIKGAAAALLQAQLPNPVFIKGYLGVQFDVLGGLVRGSCRFKLTIGDECELVVPGGSPLDMRMISDLTPRRESTDVDVFAAPQAAFAMRTGVPFGVEDDQGYRLFRIQLNSFTVTDDNNASIPGKLVWSSNKDNVSFFSNEVLPPSKKLKATVRVGFEQWLNGKWSIVYTSGQKAEETMDVTFTTGTAPKVIPMSNVEYAYPLADQRYFLKGEFPKGYVQLKRGQSYLFSKDFKHEVQVLREDGVTSIPFTYDEGSNRLTYSMPELDTQSPYTVSIVTLSQGGNAVAAVDQQNTIANSGDDLITVTNRQAGSVVRTDVGQELLAYGFTTSRHATFKEKVESIRKGREVAGYVSSDLINLQYDIVDGEPFDVAELAGGLLAGTKPLVEAEALLTDEYYTTQMYPLVYKEYPVAGMVLERDVTILGFPPKRAVPVSSAYLTEIESGNFNGIARRRFPYIYNLPLAYRQDFVDMQSKIVNRFAGTSQAVKYEDIMSRYCPLIRPGYYTIRLQYVSPDGTKGTYGDFEYYNFIK